MNRFKSVLVMFVFSVVASSLVGATQVSAVSSQTGTGLDGVCSTIGAAASSLITEDQVLLSHDAGGALIYRTLATPIPAGTYDITALSYEPQHPNDPFQGQQHEQWKINLFSGGEIVFTSGPTTDIPDELQTTTTIFGTNVEFTGDIDAIQYVHHAWPEEVTNPADLIYNSVIPACVAFEEVVVEPPVVLADPVCTITGVFDEAIPAKLTITVDTTDLLLGADTPSYLVNWGDSTDQEAFALSETMMHTYAAIGTYDVSVEVIVNGSAVATCDDPENIVKNAGVTVVLGDTDNTGGNTVVLAATGVPPVMAAVAGVLMLASVAVLSKRRSVVRS